MNNTYSEMKDSCVEWIEKIPEHWEVERAKFHFIQSFERGNDIPELLAATQKYGMYPQRLLEGVVQVMAGTDLQQFKTVHINDFVISLRSFQGGFERSTFEGVCSPAYQVFHADEHYNVDWLKYFFKNEMFIDAMNALTVGIREGRNIKYDDFANSLLPIPPLSEQAAIAAYLDEKCGESDEIIAEAKASIEEYKAWKSSVIFEAVTKGLDPHAEMKDSGVEWIGKVPKDADIVRLRKFISKIESGVSVNAGQEPAQANEIGVLKTSSVSQYIFIPSENKNVNKDELSRVSCPVKKNTLIVSRMNTPELVGACGYVNANYENLYLPDRLWQVHFNEKCNVKFMWYYLRSNFVRNYYASLSTGTSSSMQNISQAQFSNVQVVSHPYDIQKKISDYLDEKCAAIDGIIAEKEALIADMEAYKKSLIFETVTGKRKVC